MVSMNRSSFRRRIMIRLIYSLYVFTVAFLIDNVNQMRYYHYERW